MPRTTRSSWASVRCSDKATYLLEFDRKVKKLSSLEGILQYVSKKASNKFET